MRGVIDWLWGQIEAEKAADESDKSPRFYVYEAKDGWRWQLRATNGKVVAESGEAFGKRPTEKTLALIAGTFAKAVIVKGLPS